jgi:predicted phage-related endonuclease
MPIILGLSKWCQPRTLYHEKRGELERTPETRPQRMGKLLEPAAVQAFQEDTGIEVIQYPAPMYQRPDNERHLATPDAVLVGNQGLDAKCSSGFADTWEKPYDTVPDAYFVQAQWQMYVAEFDRVWFSLLLDGLHLHQIPVDRDDDCIADLIDAADTFLELLDSGTPPAWVDGPDMATVRRLYTQFTGEVIDLPDDIVQKWAEFEFWSEQKKTAEVNATAAKAAVLEALGNADAGVLPGGGYVRRKLIQKAEHVVKATSYIDFRKVKNL